MPWFKVDDSFHAHPKVLAASPAALGLWVVAGSWSGGNLSDGFIPDHVLPRLLPDPAPLAKELVAAGLWKRTRGGYRFHDWGDFNPESEAVLAEREAARKRMRAVRARRKEGATNGQRRDFEQTLEKGRAKPLRHHEERPGSGTSAAQSTDGSGEHGPNVQRTFGRSSATPTRPDPYIGGALGDPLTPGTREAPPPRCPEHLEHPTDEPCRACGDARKARNRWELADAERRRTAPNCRHHRGQPADNCALCRAEQLGAEPEDLP